jgi:hypothetical protein
MPKPGGGGGLDGGRGDISLGFPLKILEVTSNSLMRSMWTARALGSPWSTGRWWSVVTTTMTTVSFVRWMAVEDGVKSATVFGRLRKDDSPMRSLGSTVVVSGGAWWAAVRWTV